MATSTDNKLIVRLELVVEGANGNGQVTAFETARQPVNRRLSIRPLVITTPTGSPSDTTVFLIGGMPYIGATGTAPQQDGSYPQKAWAHAFPSTSITAGQFSSPVMGSVSSSVNQSDGSWSFTQGTNPVPGSNFDNRSGGANNSTLLVWYDYGGGDYQNTDIQHYHGYMNTGGALPLLAAGPGALRATFTGALAALGSVALTWTGKCWVGVSAAAGGCALTFVRDGDNHALVSSGPGTLFLVSGPIGSSDSRSWSATGIALGAGSGSFEVTIEE